MGFGLFLPAFRDEFGLSTSTAGLVASGGFFAFLVALLASAGVGRRFGERASVTTGAVAASLGFGLVATAGTPGVLGSGVALAGVSAGLCWSPFNDAAERVVAEDARATVLSVVSTGTSFGVIAAASIAFAVSEDALNWRGAWLGFALGGVVLVAITRAGMPSSRGPWPNRDAFTSIVELNLPSNPPTETTPTLAAARVSLLQRAARPLYVSALVFGMTNAIFLSFAADRVVGAGGLPGLPHEAASVAIFLAYGFFGLVGLAAGRIEAKVGLTPLLLAIFAAATLSLILVGLAPTSWPAVVAASGLHGMAIMTVSAVFSFWSLRLFPGRGSLGFTAALLAMASGSVVGPAWAGLVAAAHGPTIMFLVAAAPSLAMALWFGGKVGRSGTGTASARRR